jgi:hypothetical protein
MDFLEKRSFWANWASKSAFQSQATGQFNEINDLQQQARPDGSSKR